MEGAEGTSGETETGDGGGGRSQSTAELHKIVTRMFTIAAFSYTFLGPEPDFMLQNCMERVHTHNPGMQYTCTEGLDAPKFCLHLC